MKKGRWTVGLLFQSVEKIAEKEGEEIKHSWNTAWTLHVEGFHEARLGVTYISGSIKEIEKLVRLALERKH